MAFRAPASLRAHGRERSRQDRVYRELPSALPDLVVLEADILWRREYEGSPDEILLYFRNWLRIAFDVHQGGRSAALVGTLMPYQLELLPERAYFSCVHYLALVCRSDELTARLRLRPGWRGFSDERIAEAVAFNNWIRANAAETSPPITALDTSAHSVDQTRTSVVEWVQARLDSRLGV